ncbi:acetyl-CoA C-acyltransferase [Natrialba magadii ATCC 43099]|uniref:Acetyl-CoA C-acyltransferase n=1 Tax=Natrialba magadii (strain ATCC 43099 / DSM 3394 / CCM 3739 / CIP 104546 / IAM 13178 / JCM 8861 / NBRC 102185 / NCIMB 2190 / MS3) TaxID=547559 RepID=D3ST92_NATMM|nr:thiolase family protein [Natrialba magadii]ADD06959.1 acetyl-CoA C-acyltransferase [Natrialba magadii ATCC 43099]ELY28416.1 acetyl-CoA acetyltransferase [Natrialba magadii ATCC 43099]
MHEAVIVDAVRTPFAKRDGSFRDTHPQDLAAKPLEALEERNKFDPEVVEDVIYGCVTPIGEQGANIGRLAPMVAGWGDGVPGVQLNRMCGSGQQAVNFAAANVMAGQHDVLVAGGVEHMTREPMGSDGDGVTDTYFEYFDEVTHQGEGAERIAENYGFSREELDELAVDSQRRWGEAWDAGYYDDQVVPVETALDGEESESGSDSGSRTGSEPTRETITVEQDEHPRPETDLETLAGLPLAFREEGNGVHHPGNSSGIVDGSSAILIASREAAEEHGWEPMARIVQTEVVGVDPITMLTGPIPATEGVLEKADMELEEIDLFEVNEAFASVVAAWLEETGVSWEQVNVNGGAIAHGHPLGGTGAMLLTKLAHELERTGKDTALSTMCIGFGQGVATIIERV